MGSTGQGVFLLAGNCYTTQFSSGYPWTHDLLPPPPECWRDYLCVPTMPSPHNPFSQLRWLRLRKMKDSSKWVNSIARMQTHVCLSQDLIISLGRLTMLWWSLLIPQTVPLLNTEPDISQLPKQTWSCDENCKLGRSTNDMCHFRSRSPCSCSLYPLCQQRSLRAYRTLDPWC